MTDVKVYYFHHQDRLYNLRPFLLLDGERVWQCYKKRNGAQGHIYYLFIDEYKYIKLLRDKKGNLLFYIGNTRPVIFAREEPEIFYIETIINYLDDFSDDFIIYVNNKIKFTVPVIGVVRRLNQWATRPLVYLLYQLFAYNTPAEAQEVQQKEVTEDGYS